MLRVVMAAVEGTWSLLFFYLCGLTDLVLQSESFLTFFLFLSSPKSLPLVFFSSPRALNSVLLGLSISTVLRTNLQLSGLI